MNKIPDVVLYLAVASARARVHVGAPVSMAVAEIADRFGIERSRFERYVIAAEVGCETSVIHGMDTEEN